jgi:hypothetical protein
MIAHSTFVYRIGPIFVLVVLAIAVSACSPTLGSSGPGSLSGPEPTPIPPGTVVVDGSLDNLPSWTRTWSNTDLSRRTVHLREIRSGGVPRDGIPPIDNPLYVSPEIGDVWYEPQEPVILIELNGDARAYPLQILTWHEIVNTEIGGQKIAVTFCPLCNSAVAFDRNIDGLETLRLGVSGLLRHSDLVMWDNQTESLWQQITGESIVGELAGERLKMAPAIIVSWEAFRSQHPDGLVLSRDTGFSRSYGANPYVGYDTIDQSPFLFDGETDDRLSPMMRVLGVDIAGESRAYPFSELEERRVVNDTVGGVPIVVFWQSGVTSALDKSDIADSRDVGMATALRPVVNGMELTFTIHDTDFRDHETGSLWNVFGVAIEGPLEGERLEGYVSGAHFWFAWAAFKPDTGIWRPSIDR